ncbi:peptidase M28, partial [Flavihumibacter sediminis]|nr:peptidase M28 [Flavihumibacter sediminis]
MKKALILLALTAAGYATVAQTIVSRDPLIEKMVSQVSSDSLQAYIDQLVKFGTRHTLSSTTDPKRGIGAARNWVVQKFNQFAVKTNG